MLLALALPVAAQLSLGAPTLKQEVMAEADGVAPGGTLRVLVVYTLPPSWHVNAHKPLEDFLIPTVLDVAVTPPLKQFSVAYPEAHQINLSFSETPLAVYESGFAIGAVLTLAEDAAPGNHELKATLKYQACNDTTCAAPQTLEFAIPVRVTAPGQAITPQHTEKFAAHKWEQAPAATPMEPATAPAPAETPAVSAAAPGADFKVLAEAFEVAAVDFGYKPVPEFVAFLDRAEGKAAVGETPSGFQERSGLAVVLLVLLGGLALNLTPCVLPLIPINIAIIGAGAKAGSKTRGFLLGLAYGLGISAVYGALGLAVVLGLSSAFGTINASPWFNLGIAALFVVLGLAMFDVIYIDFSKYQAKVSLRKNEGGSFAVAMVMGGISALLAGACVAPVVIYTIVYAQDQYSQGQHAALLLPFLLGVGMALPWPVAGAGLSMLPKPGGWMNTVKHAFGVFILAFACYYGYEAYALFRAPAAQVREAGQDQAGAPAQGEWTANLEEGLRRAKAEGKPVLLDFWATWCKNCLLMDRNVLHTPEVLQRTEGYVKIKYEVRDAGNPPDREVLEKYGVKGLPTYAVLHPKGR